MPKQFHETKSAGSLPTSSDHLVPTMLLSLAWSGAALLAMVAVGLALEEAASRQLLFLHLVPIGPSPFAADLNLNEPVLRCARCGMQRALPSTRLASSARHIGCRPLARRAPCQRHTAAVRFHVRCRHRSKR